MEDRNKVRREFEDLERRIARLKELEKRLDSLDLEGFHDEADSIKTKLKDPSAVEKIEEELNLLQTRIQERAQGKSTVVSPPDSAKLRVTSRMQKELGDLERRITKLREMEGRLNSLDLDGFRDEANSIQAKLKDPTAVAEIEDELSLLETKVQQRDVWKTTGAKLFDSAVDLCNKGSRLFYEKEYAKALKAFARGIDRFIGAREVAQHSDRLLGSIDENIVSAKRNIAACNLGLGAAKSEAAQEQFISGNYRQAIKESQAALSYFKTAKEGATEIEDEDKLASAEKFIGIMNSNIDDCYVAMDKDKVDTLSQTVDSLISAAQEAGMKNNLAGALGKLAKAEEACQEAIALAQQRAFADPARSLKETMKNISQLKEEFWALQAQNLRVAALEKRLDSLDMEGLEDQAESIRAKLKDPLAMERMEDEANLLESLETMPNALIGRLVERMEDELTLLEEKTKQRDLWKTKGAGLFESAVEVCNEATGAFYRKEYEHALGLFREGVDRFATARDAAQHDSHLLNSIDQNMVSAKRNIVACNLGLGALKSEAGQQQFNAGDCQRALSEFQAALAYFEAAKHGATHTKDKDKLTSATKLISVMNSNIEDCYVAMDKDKVDRLSETVNTLLEEARRAEMRKDLKEANEKLLEAEKTCGEALELSEKRDFAEAVEMVKELMKTIADRMSSLGKEPLPRIEEVEIDIAIDESEP